MAGKYEFRRKQNQLSVVIRHHQRRRRGHLHRCRGVVIIASSHRRFFPRLFFLSLVHPCGRYNMQSLVNILEKYYKNKTKNGMSDVKKLYTIHRLDRLTSGLVILGKTSSVARSYSKYIMNRSCQKIYLARVAGKFPLRYRSLEKSSSKQLLQSGIPLNGEWNEETSVDNDKDGVQKQATSSFSNEIDPTKLVSRLRKQNALACWIEDGKGTPIFEYVNGSQTNMLEQIFHCRHRYVCMVLLCFSLYLSPRTTIRLFFSLITHLRL